MRSFTEVTPASVICVSLRKIGRIDRTAAGLRQIAPLCSDSRRHKSQCWPSMTAPPCTQNRLYLGPLFPSLWGSAPKQTHPLKCPPEQRFAPARLPHSGPLNTAKVAASSDRASLPPVPACSQSCSANSRAQALPLRLWLESFRCLQIASCSFSFPSAEDVPATAQGSRLGLACS